MSYFTGLFVLCYLYLCLGCELYLWPVSHCQRKKGKGGKDTTERPTDELTKDPLTNHTPSPYSASYSKSRSHLPPQQQPPPQSLPLSQPSNNVLPYGWNNNSSHSMATTLPALGNITTTNSGNNNNNTTPTTDISSNNNNTSNETLHTNTGTPSSFNASNSNSIAPPPYFRTYAHDPMAGSYYHTPPPPQQPQRGVGHHLDVTSGGSGGVGGGGMVEMAYGRPGREFGHGG